MSITGLTRPVRVRCLLALFPLLFAPRVWAVEPSDLSHQEVPAETPAVKQKLAKEWTEFADIIGTYNPKGIDVSGGIQYRDPYRYDDHYDEVSSYWQTGASIDITPSYAQPSVHFEWMPWLFLVTRLEYDGYYYFGTNGALLSFASGKEPFGDPELRARRGTEESGFGHRIFFQPTVQTKVSGIVVRNQTDIARYWFSGKGPFFLEQEYDTLLKDGDLLYANRTQVLKEVRLSEGRTLYVGPYYELVHAQDADLTRQRVGVLFSSERVHDSGYFGSGHFFAEIGYNLEDRNREGQIFFLIGVGGASVLK